MLQEKHQSCPKTMKLIVVLNITRALNLNPQTPQAIPFSPAPALKPINNKATIRKLVSPQPLLLIVLSLINSQNSYRQ
jgi:hypothetical protein